MSWDIWQIFQLWDLEPNHHTSKFSHFHKLSLYILVLLLLLLLFLGIFCRPEGNATASSGIWILSLLLRKQGLSHLGFIYFHPLVARSVVSSDPIWNPSRRRRRRGVQGQRRGFCVRCPCPVLHCRCCWVSSSVHINLQLSWAFRITWYKHFVIEIVTSWSMQGDQCSELLEPF